MECQVHYLIQKCVSKCGLYTNDYKFQISLHYVPVTLKDLVSVMVKELSDFGLT